MAVRVQRRSDWTLGRTKGPASLPIELSLAKQFLRVSADALDDELSASIEGATAIFEADTDMCVISQQFRYRRDQAPGSRDSLIITKRPLQSIQTIQYGGATIDPTVYTFAPESSEIYLQPNQVWPGNASGERLSFTVDCTVGLAEIPAQVPRDVVLCLMAAVGASFYRATKAGDSYQRAYDDLIDGFARATYP